MDNRGQRHYVEGRRSFWQAARGAHYKDPHYWTGVHHVHGELGTKVKLLTQRLSFRSIRKQ